MNKFNIDNNLIYNLRPIVVKNGKPLMGNDIEINVRANKNSEVSDLQLKILINDICYFLNKTYCEVNNNEN